MAEQNIYEENLNEHKWKLYEASRSRTDGLNRLQSEQDGKLDRWMMTTAAGSFGLSFAFLNGIVDIKSAVHTEILIAGWSCFLAVLAAGMIGFMASSFLHSLLAEEENKALSLKLESKEPEYKNRSMFLGANAVIGYLQILFFIGGSVCLLLFIAKNFA